MHRTRPRGRPRQASLDEHILQATLRLLGEKGYARMSLDDIATAAHTTRATIYLRYPSKAELAATACIHARHSFVSPMLIGDLRQDLVAQLRHFQESMAAPHSLPIIGTALAEERTTPELLAALRAHVIGSRRQMLRAILGQAQSRNELAPHVDVDLAVTQFVGSYYALAIAGEPVPVDWAERVVDQVLSGLLHRVSERQEH